MDVKRRVRMCTTIEKLRKNPDIAKCFLNEEILSVGIENVDNAKNQKTFIM